MVWGMKSKVITKLDIMLRKVYLKIKKKFIQLFFGRIGLAKYLGVNFGKDCRIYINEWGTEPFLITLGDRVTVTAGVIFLTHDGATWLTKDDKGRRYKYQKIIVGNNVFIGVNSIIMPGVIIGDNVIVAAGSVVVKSIPSNSVVGGNPAKYLDSFDNYHTKSIIQNISDSDVDYSLKYKDRIMNLVDEKMKTNLRDI